MTHTALFPAQKAGQLQKTVGDFNCVLQEIAVAANMMAKVTVVGDEPNVKALFESVGEPITDETTE